ncbi:MAG: AAA family ATPase [Oscillibacter sp.]|nr:AAA family ATPase [Oscillibacter sp.]
MGTGIIICGLNGVGKSTLGKALAEKLRFHFIDNEDLYFPKTDPRYIYASPRTREEVEMLFLHEIQTHENFVFASVKGDYGDAVSPLFQYAVLIDVPKDIRMRRVRERSFRKFGSRMLPGGDLYEQEENFLRLVSSRAENMVEEWVESLSCPVIRIDGTKSIKENTYLIIERIQRLRGGFCQENGAFGCDLPAE